MKTLTAVAVLISIFIVPVVRGDSQRAEVPPETAIKIANDLIEKMTVAEKVAMLRGDHIYSCPGVPRLGIPPMLFADGPCSLRPDLNDNGAYAKPGKTDDCATAFPPLSALAATWDPALARAFGKALSSEVRARGKDMSLGPAINIMRTPLCGRTFEYMGEDPWLTAHMCVPVIQGVQSNDVAACVKHFAMNNQELDRFGVDVNVDERTMREIYLPGFEAAVTQGHSMSIMGAYNRVNGLWCCENPYLLQGILRGEWGFRGLVISDWGAVHNGIWAALAGCQQASGSGVPYSRLAEFVQKGAIPQEVLDTMVRQRLLLYVNIRKIGPQAAMRTKGEINTPAHAAVARQIASEAIVLLKNDGHLLPLDAGKLKSILVLGSIADSRLCVGIGHDTAGGINRSGGSGEAKPLYEVTALEGLRKRLGTEVKIEYVQTTSTDTRSLPLALDLPAIANRAKVADAVFLFTGDTHEQEQESKDRPDMNLPKGQDEIVKALISQNSRTIVINQSGAPVAMPWSDRAPAIVQYWFCGQEGGTALAGILFGDTNPSGKLPCTFPRKLEDVPAHVMGNYKSGELSYAEGILVGYRWFDTKQIEPLFPFGHGLSYTTFEYGPLEVDKTMAANGKLIVRVPITNSGNRDGAEVSQLYLHEVTPKVLKPEQELKGFARVELAPGQKGVAEFTLTPRDLSHWSIEEHGWKADPGAFEIRVGSSSREIRRKAQFEYLTAQ